jgi:hypothetical protein
MVEKRSMRNSSRRQRLAAIAVAGAIALAAWGLADSPATTTEYVKDSTNVLDAPNVLGNLVTSLNKGSTVTVLQTQGDWAQVQSGAFTGWIVTAELTTQQPGGDLFGGLGASNNAAASGATASAAGKGFSENAQNWSDYNHLDPSLVKNNMEGVRAQISIVDLEAFANSPEGKLGKF